LDSLSIAVLLLFFLLFWTVQPEWRAIARKRVGRGACPSHGRGIRDTRKDRLNRKGLRCARGLGPKESRVRGWGAAWGLKKLSVGKKTTASHEGKHAVEGSRAVSMETVSSFLIICQDKNRKKNESRETMTKSRPHASARPGDHGTRRGGFRMKKSM
jgi:hypothetical protein